MYLYVYNIIKKQSTMNSNKIFSSLITLILIINCSSDDKDLPEDLSLKKEGILQETQNPSIDKLQKGISINNSELILGDIPSSTKDLNFSIEEKEIIGLLNYGFELKLNVPNNYKGAYIQLKSDNQNISKKYFKISKSLNTSKKEVSPNDEKSLTSTIKVVFDDSIKPGSFCVQVSYFDDNGDTSPIKEACIKVLDWANNPKYIGNWKLKKIVHRANNNTFTILANTKACDSFNMVSTSSDNRIPDICNANTVKESNIWCFFHNTEFNLNSDGSNNFKTTYRSLIPFTDDTCVTERRVFFDDKRTSNGYWTYDANNKRLILFSTNLLITSNSPIEARTPEGDLDPNYISIPNDLENTYTYKKLGSGISTFDNIIEIDDNNFMIRSISNDVTENRNEKITETYYTKQ